MATKVVLEVEKGIREGARFEFEGHDLFVFGRAAGCDASLGRDPYASRHHFMIESDGVRAVVRDLGSHNGTFVGRRKLTARRPQLELSDGDVVRAGRTSLRVTIDAPGKPMSVRPSRGKRRHGVPASLGPFDIDAEIGRGSFGVTYRGRHRPDGKVVAIKAFFGTKDAAEEARQRFLREMDVLRSLEDPNIVAMVDAGAEGDLLYIAMEFCDRGPAKRLLENYPEGIPLADMKPVLLGASRGLAYAHARGIVHRDIKPENVLLTGSESGIVAKLADFGLAKGFDSAGFSGVTISGAAGGTLAYMPREQLLDFKRVRPVSDVWSLGATFYHLLSGAPPRKKSSVSDPLRTVLEGEVVPLWKRRPELPDAVRLVIERSLAADPEDRFQSGREMADALARAL